MLPVAVDGDDTAQLRELLPHIAEGGLERPTLAAVDLVGQHRAAGLLCCLVKEMAVFRLAPVVDDHKVPKAFPEKAFDDTDKLFVRIE